MLEQEPDPTELHTVSETHMPFFDELVVDVGAVAAVEIQNPDFTARHDQLGVFSRDAVGGEDDFAFRLRPTVIVPSRSRKAMWFVS